MQHLVTGNMYLEIWLCLLLVQGQGMHFVAAEILLCCLSLQEWHIVV